MQRNDCPCKNRPCRDCPYKNGPCRDCPCKNRPCRDCPSKNGPCRDCPCKNMQNGGCPYKNILGKPQDGVRAYRVANIAIVDVILTIIVAFIISAVFAISFWKVLGVSFLLGIVLNRFFCVRTTVDKLLFTNV